MMFKCLLLLCLLAPIFAKSVLDFRTPINNRIVGGHEALVGEFPHQASLYLYTRKNVKTHPTLASICGASILNENWLLTAAECLSLTFLFSMDASVGKHLMQYWNNTSEEFAQFVKVKDQFIYEKYEEDGFKHNIAVLKLAKPLKFNERVQPIALPKANSEIDGQVILSGWGLTNPNNWYQPEKLQKAYLPVIDLEICANLITNIYGYSPLDDENLCTGPLEAGAATCLGDQGNPLIKVKEDGKKELIGIVSWSYELCGQQNAPSVFTKVSYYVDWINNVISNN